jgi:protein-tyrosine-phosphatase/predicted ATP-grasp superfamily ATP-dependent carboligase
VDAASLVSWLGRLDAGAAYALVLPSTEASLVALRTLPAEDSLRRRAVMPSDLAIDTALDKHRTCELAGRLGVPIPASLLLRSFGDVHSRLPPPTVLKPLRSKVTIEGALVTLAPVVATDDRKREKALASWLPHTPVLEQTWVPGCGVGVELLYEHGRKVWHFAHRRLHEMPLSGGASSYRCSLEPPRRLLDAAESLLTALDWHGVAMVEFRVERDGSFWLMEINPRLWGSLALAIDVGVDFPRGLLSLAQGKPPGPQPSIRPGHFTRCLPLDVQWFKQNLMADHSNPFLLTVPIGQSLLEPLRLLTGNESWDHFDFRDPRVGWTILIRIVVEQLAALRRRFARVLRTLLVRRRHAQRVSSQVRATPAVRTILFLCHGNICRSPVAEQVARRVLPTRHLSSAGFHSSEGRVPPEHIQRAARGMGLDLSGHRSRRVHRSDVDNADLVLVMDPENLDALVTEYPEAERKTMLLGLFDTERRRQSIPDPYELDEDDARDVLLQIQRAAVGLAFWLDEETAAPPASSASAKNAHPRVVPSHRGPGESRPRGR